MHQRLMVQRLHARRAQNLRSDDRNRQQSSRLPVTVEGRQWVDSCPLQG